jgi:hypothetical protein
LAGYYVYDDHEQFLTSIAHPNKGGVASLSQVASFFLKTSLLQRPK